jgi:hypothetical protein
MLVSKMATDNYDELLVVLMKHNPHDDDGGLPHIEAQPT